MKICFLLLTFSVHFLCMAQSDADCRELTRKEVVDKIKNQNPVDLVPFSTDGDSWGLFNVKSRKVYIQSLFSLAATFHPDLAFYFYIEECEGRVDQNYSYSAKPLEIEMTTWSGEKSISKATLDKPGFEVDESGKLLAYSKSYNRDPDDSWNISQPVLFKEKYYAVLHKSSQDVLINQLGEEQSDFIFKQMTLLPYKRQGEHLFYVKDLNDKMGFITLSGKKYLYGELMKSPLYHNELFGYSVQHNGADGAVSLITSSGILDLTTQKWLVKPQKRFKIYSMVYTSEVKIEDEKSAENREKVTIYFLLADGKKHFIMDTKGKVIKPVGL